MNTQDETAYLLKSPANRKRLLQAIENVARGDSLVAVDPNVLLEISRVLTRNRDGETPNPRS